MLGLSDVNRELKIERVNETDGDNYDRFQQYYNDIPVYGRSIVIPAQKDGTANALTSNAITPTSTNTEPKTSEEKA